jgi:hypothetical protein
MKRSLLSLAAVLLTSSVSSAQQLSAEQAAEARFKSGLKYYDAREFESARIEFTQAYAILRRSELLRNLALSELYSNHLVEALGHFRTYLADPDIPEDKRARTKKLYDDAFARTGHVQVVAPAGAQVTLEDRSWTAPVSEPIDVVPGSYVVKAKKGVEEKSREVEALPGKVVEVEFRFTEDSSPATAVGPAVPAPPPASVPAASVARDDEGPSFWNTGRALGVGTAALGLGAIVGGVVMASKAGDTRDRLDSLRAQSGGSDSVCAASASAVCAERDQLAEDRASQQNWSTALLVGGCTLVAGGALLFFLWPRQHGASTRATLSPGLGNIFITGAF